MSRHMCRLRRKPQRARASLCAAHRALSWQRERGGADCVTRAVFAAALKVRAITAHVARPRGVPFRVCDFDGFAHRVGDLFDKLVSKLKVVSFDCDGLAIDLAGYDHYTTARHDRRGCVEHTHALSVNAPHVIGADLVTDLRKVIVIPNPVRVPLRRTAPL